LRSSQVFEDGDQVEEFIVVGVGEPAADRNGMLGMEDVGGWGIVDDDGLLQITADLREVLFRLELDVDISLGIKHTLT
jgi:hypothetical protein